MSLRSMETDASILPNYQPAWMIAAHLQFLSKHKQSSYSLVAA